MKHLKKRKRIDIILSEIKKERNAMRVFLAILFDEEIKKLLMNSINELKSSSISGNFTPEENLHQTLVFIGEIPYDKVKTIRNITDECFTSPFDITVTGFGKFQGDGDEALWWAGIQNAKPLSDLYDVLSDELNRNGIPNDYRKYNPHITLGRRVILMREPNFTPINHTMTVNRISLMKSERISGKIKYTEIMRTDTKKEKDK